MALHPKFPSSPYEPLVPAHRWFPADEALRTTALEKLLPPLVGRIREEVHAWRESGYVGASATSVALLKWWFEREHLVETANGTLTQFRYYFAQREAVETVVWLYDVRRAHDKYDLIRFDASGAVSAGMFPEEWTRYVLKLATGAGKTKVISLLIAWSYFHRTYEPQSSLSRNFLLIAPNIIVLDRLRADFDGHRIFFQDPILPVNGFEGRSWRDDFQISLHIQDDVRVARETGNIFLTNIHRVFLRDVPDPSLDDDDLLDYFLSPFGSKAVSKTTDSGTDLGAIVRDISELAVFNDEAHHIHNEQMAWFKSIQDIHHRLRQKDTRLSLQLDVTATPRHESGAIFVQTVSDYPLVEAIHQNVVKHPVLPDAVSREKLVERHSTVFPERYRDYLALGVEEWRKSYADLQRLGKKAVLFVMVDDTKNCDDVGAHLEKTVPELENAVLVIHTKRNGEIAEGGTGKKRDELELLRAQSERIDTWESPYKAIVSVLMLKEGWDVKNVTTIVGLRAYGSPSKVLPEQTLGRGLRRMFFGTDVEETVSVMGTPAFMEFVESIQSEGVVFERRPMGGSGPGVATFVVEVDRENAEKDIESLDIPIPRVSRRYHRDFRQLDELDEAKLGNDRIKLRQYSDAELREIVFKRMLDGEVDHTIVLDTAVTPDYRAVIAFFSRQILSELRMVGGYDLLYGKVKRFLQSSLFDGAPVNLEDANVLRNLSETDAVKITFDAFARGINALTLRETGTTRIEAWIRLTEVRPFRTESRPFLAGRKCIFNKTVGEARSGGLEMSFAAFLEAAPDVQSYAKNYLAIGFKLDFVRTNGELSNYVPDFIVRDTSGGVWIVETKGREELDLPQKMRRLKQWCADVTEASREVDGIVYRFVYVDEAGFTKHPPTSLAALVAGFTEYQGAK